MTTLVVGATGATGRLLVDQLLARGQHVRAIVRKPDKLAERAGEDDRLALIEADLADLSAGDLAAHVAGCRAVASCLGHNLSLAGIYGRPRRLVADATRRLCEAVRASEPGRTTRFVLMNTAGNRNRDLAEPVAVRERLAVGAIRLLLPPHVDNERAAEYLRTEIGPRDPAIQWAVVRPDSLVDRDTVTEYEVHPSPTRSALFDPGTSSRINVAHFMATLVTDDEAWLAWRGKMPVIYDGQPG
jgi:nucleoside-diphosphate-sugar epimerase